MKGTEAIAKALKVEGVEILTCFPLNQIIDAASAIGIRPIVTRTERVAVNIADGYSRQFPRPKTDGRHFLKSLRQKILNFQVRNKLGRRQP